ERSVFSPRRAIIIVDLAAPRAIVPVPTLARVLRRTFELLLGDVEAVPPQAGVIFEGLPGDRIVVAAEAQEATKLEGRVSDVHFTTRHAMRRPPAERERERIMPGFAPAVTPIR